MSLNLQKGSSLKLTKDDGKTALNRIRVELSWNPNESSSQHAFDLDVVAALCKNESLQAVSNEDVAFFNNKNTPVIQVSPDNRTGAGDGVDEFLDITLSKVLEGDGDRIPVLICIYGARAKGQSFAQVDGATVVLRDLDCDQIIGSCNISEKGTSSDESLLVGVFEKQSDGSFVYNQVNEFYNKSFEEWIGVFTN